MALVDWFGSETQCPECGKPGAKKFLWQVKCRNMACGRFDRGFLYATPGSTTSSSHMPAPRQRVLKGGFDPGAHAVQIRYRNFQGEEKSFTGDRRTVRRRGNHISVCLAPTGKRVSLARDRIQNATELDSLAREESKLTPKERQIVGYHRKRGSTSALYESLKRKYPQL